MIIRKRDRKPKIKIIVPLPRRMNTNAKNPVEDYKTEALFGRSRLNVNIVIACRIDDDFPQNCKVFIANKLI